MEWPQQTIIRRLIVVFIILVLGTATFYYYHSQYDLEVAREREALAGVTKKLDLNLNSRLMALQILASDPEIISLEPDNVHKELVRPVEIMNFFNARVFDSEGKLVAEANHSCSLGEAHNKESFDKALNDNQVISDVVVCEELQLKYISLRVPIYNDNGQIKAVLAGGILLDELSHMLAVEELPASHYVFIMDRKNKIVYYPNLPNGLTDGDVSRYMKNDFNDDYQGKLAYDSLIDKDENVYIYKTLDNSDWRIVMVIPRNEIYKNVLEKHGLYFVLLCLIILCVGLLYRNFLQTRYFEENMRRLRMERLMSVNQMAAGLAHEIRNPLTSIKGFIQLIGRKADKASNQNHLEIVLSEIDRIDQLIGEFQHLTVPLKEPKFVEIDMARMVHDVIVLMESQAVIKNVALNFSNNVSECNASYVDLIDGVLRCEKNKVLGDEAHLKQVFINLIKNGIDAVDQNGVLDIVLSRQDKMSVITIRDNGIGMSQAVLKKIGTPFFTTKESGNGLGLSVCYNIIESHGGKIKVDSEVGKGTVFSVIVPCVE